MERCGRVVSDREGAAGRAGSPDSTMGDTGRHEGSVGSALRVGAVTALALIAGSEWSRVFGWGVTGVPVVLATLLPVAIAYGMGRRRDSSVALSAAVSLVAFYWFISVAVLHTTVLAIVPSLATFSGVYRGIVDAWAQILSVPLPATGPADMLVLPCTVVWIAAALGTEIVQRARFALVGTIPALVALLIALPFGIGSGGERSLQVIVFLAVVLLLAGATASPVVEAAPAAHRKVTLRRLAEAGLLTIMAVTVAFLAGPSLPVLASGHAYDPRAGWVPPTSPVQAISPLDELSKWAQAPPKVLFTITSSSASPPSFKLAYMPAYSDLLGWTSSSRFERIGQVVPAGSAGVVRPSSEGPVVDVVQRFSITPALPGPWLPTDGRALEIHGVQALADLRTGVLMAASGHASGASYTVRSQTRASTPNCTTHDVLPGPTLTLPPQVEQLAQRLTQGAATPCQQALDLENALHNTSLYTFDATAPAGTNIAVMENFLYGSKPGSKRGTSEQFASAFALLAESLGLPARVYMGFHSGTSLGGNRWQVTTRDAYAGAEIDFAGIGWVAFDPTRRPGNVPPPPDERVKGHSSAITSPLPGVSSQHVVQGPVAQAKAPEQLSGLAVVATVIGALIAGILVLLGALAAAVALVRRRRRRLRRDAASAKGRVIGAWLETIDQINSLGVDRDRSRTAAEVVAVGAQRLGRESVVDLEPMARMVNAATFSKWEPDDDAALDAWRHADSVGVATVSVLGRRGRFVRAIDIRTVWRS